MKIAISNIDHNPHRDMKRNPLDKAQVKTIVESINRNNWGENVIVRKHPTQKGRYQLAYGHHRLAALKNLGVEQAEFIVKEVDDWAMYTWMVDENESQREVSPALIFENIEAGINFLEPIVRECETAEEFNSLVPRGTDGITPDSYAQVRNGLLSGEGLGVSFLSSTLPNGSSTRRNNVQAVVDSHYAKTKSQAKQKRADAKKAEADAKRKAAEAAESAAVAKKARAEAEKLDAQSAELESQAKALNSIMAQKLLLKMPTTRHMAELASAVKANKIPAANHADLVSHILNNDVRSKQVRRAVEQWWFVASGESAKRRADTKRQEFRRKHKSKSLEDFAAELNQKVKAVAKEIHAVLNYTDQIENPRLRASLSDSLLNLSEGANAVGTALRNESDHLTPDLPALELVK
jgi:ParB-like chromosome segregation protein Spo0J